MSKREGEPNFEEEIAEQEGTEAVEGVEEVEDKKEEEEKEPDKIGEVFDELIDKVKDSPEAEDKALNVLIEQIHQIGEQMREERDVKHYLKLQKTMVEHWQKLEEMTKDNPQLLAELNEWKKKYVDNKELMMEMINGLKKEILDKTLEVESIWNSCQVDMGEAQRQAVENIKKEGEVVRAEKIPWSSMGEEMWEDLYSKIAKGHPKYEIEEFIASCNDVKRGYSVLEGDLPDLKIGKFSSWFSTGLRKAGKLGADRSLLEGLQEKITGITTSARQVSKIFAQIKIIRDTKPLEVL